MSYRFTKLNAQHIAQMKMQKPPDLDIYSSEVSEHIFSLFSDALQQIPVTSLDIGATNLSLEQLKAMLEQFSIKQIAPRRLQLLSLAKLRLGPCVKQLGNYLQQYHCVLEELDLHDCGLGNAGLTQLLPFFELHFQHSASLKHVNLRKNQIQTVAAVNLRKMIESSQIFCNFDLQLNQINETVLDWFTQPRKAGVKCVDKRVREMVVDAPQKERTEDMLSQQFHQFKESLYTTRDATQISQELQAPVQIPPQAYRLYDQDVAVPQAQPTQRPLVPQEASAAGDRAYFPTAALIKDVQTRPSRFDQYYLKTRDLTANTEPLRAQLQHIPAYQASNPVFFTEEEPTQQNAREQLEEIRPAMFSRRVEALHQGEQGVTHATEAKGATQAPDEPLTLDDVQSADTIIVTTTPISYRKNIFKATAKNAALQETDVSTQYAQKSRVGRQRSLLAADTKAPEKRGGDEGPQPPQREQTPAGAQLSDKSRQQRSMLFKNKPLDAEREKLPAEAKQPAQLTFSQMQQASFSPTASVQVTGGAQDADIAQILAVFDSVPELYFKLKAPKQVSYIKQRIQQLRDGQDELIQGNEGAQLVLETFNQIYQQLISQGLLFGEIKHPQGICAVQDYISTVGVEMYKLILSLIKQQGEYDLDEQQQ